MSVSKTVKPRSKEEIVNDILGYLRDNEDDFVELMEELDSWSRYLGDDRWCDMDELNEFYAGSEPIEILNRAYFGRDNDSWTIDRHGEKRYDSFNPNRDYFSFDGYGNLVSSDYRDYSNYLTATTVLDAFDVRDKICCSDELNRFFDELELAKSEEEWEREGFY